MLGGYQLIDLTNLEPISVNDTINIDFDSVVNKLDCGKLIILKINLNVRGSIRTVLTTLSSVSDGYSTEFNSSYITSGVSRIYILLTKESKNISLIAYP